jgi:hypothetical protein
MPLGHGQLDLPTRWRLGRTLAKVGYDQAIVLPGSMKSALIPWFAGIAQRTGFRGEMRFGLLNDLRTLNAQRLPKTVQRFVALGLPADAAQPTAEERGTIARWIGEFALVPDCSTGERPGRVTLRRLNRAEYDNTVRDLFGVKVRPAADFPADDIGYGFDSIGDVLTLPPVLLERYLAAAEEIVREVVFIAAWSVSEVFDAFPATSCGQYSRTNPDPLEDVGN